jgi:hypothetical protein
VIQDVLADPVQRRGVKRPSMTSQLSFGGLTLSGAHASGDRADRLSQASFMYHEVTW